MNVMNYIGLVSAIGNACLSTTLSGRMGWIVVALFFIRDLIFSEKSK